MPAGGDVADDATFSPNSSLVLYRAEQNSDGLMELFSVSSGGGTPVRLNATLVAGGNVVRASFSPDGSRVVYLADQDTNEEFELYAVPSFGGSPVKISGPMTGGGNVIDWQFSPDGQRVVYRADQDVDEQFELYSASFANDTPGDFNHDGRVNAADYTVWRNGLRSTYSVSDFSRLESQLWHGQRRRVGRRFACSDGGPGARCRQSLGPSPSARDGRRAATSIRGLRPPALACPRGTLSGMAMMADKPKGRRWRYVAIAAALAVVASCVVGALLFVQSIIDFVELDAAQRRIADGLTTREQERERFGPDVDQWPGPAEPAK